MNEIRASSKTTHEPTDNKMNSTIGLYSNAGKTEENFFAKESSQESFATVKRLFDRKKRFVASCEEQMKQPMEIGKKKMPIRGNYSNHYTGFHSQSF